MVNKAGTIVTKHRFKNTLSRGFTLMEALVTVSVLVVVVGLAAPAFSTFLDRQSVRSDSQFGLKAFSTARTQATVITAASTFVCWNLSDAVAVMADTDTSYNLQPGSIIVAEGTAGDFDQIITSGIIRGETNAVFDNDNDNCVGFNAQGRLTNSSNPAIFAMTFCRDVNDTEDARRLEINAAGRVSIKLNTDTTGVGAQSCN